MNELPERRRAMLVAARIGNRRHSEIAAEHGVSVRTVEMKIRNVLDFCRHRLEEHGAA
ncbi:sigma factor-like helix-turn-helix DNA-binding protein [Breoghania sp.]|uniref:sigma factor-like helix-turn-helix DNA-binding protein n=1 Tax=Breoghania sp. TaxID=2065378 RepID=UPI00262DA875|nr:sigma factor-like helix-turn-helix DNA-binding protein [Breoghania sp.]MDJ0930595.1 sigma factor-like helix-turn-helix DNA-binding protein [Breoghania sp.]